ncbi:MAG: hypothetical protein ACLSDJ_01945 [Butyricimonas faecihominis]
MTGLKPTKIRWDLYMTGMLLFVWNPAWDVKMQNPKPLGYEVGFKVKETMFRDDYD